MNKKLKYPSKFFAILLAVLLVVGMLPTVAFAEGVQDIPGLEDTTGSGTESDPVVVDTFDELKAALEYDNGLIDTFYIQLNQADEDETVPKTSSYSAAIRSVGVKTLIVEGNNVYYAPMGGQTDCLIANSRHLTIKGNGTLTFKAVLNNGTNAVVRNSATLIVEGNPTLNGSYNSAVYGTAILSEGGNLIIKSGTFHGYNAFVKDYTHDTSAVTISNGTFSISGGTFRQDWAAGISEEQHGLFIRGGSGTILGGKFYNIKTKTETGSGANLSEFLKEGYSFFDESDNLVNADTNDILKTVTVKETNPESVDPIEISSVVLDMAEPKVGDTIVLPTSSNSSYEVASQSGWSGVTEGTDKFEAGKTYTLQAYVAIPSDNEAVFAAAPAATINEKDGIFKGKVNDKLAVFEWVYTLEAEPVEPPALTPITSAEFTTTGFEAGKNVEDTTVQSTTEGLNITGKFWYLYDDSDTLVESGTFDADKEYVVVVCLTAKEGYTFDLSEKTVTIDGFTATYTGAPLTEKEEAFGEYAVATVLGQPTVPGPVEPVTTHTLTIVNGVCLKYEDEKWYTTAEYKEGDIILISPDEAPEGMQFDQWVIEGPGSIEDPKDPAGVFTMGNGDATVTATYAKVVDTFDWSLDAPVAGTAKPQAKTTTTGVKPVETVWYDGAFTDGSDKETTEFVAGQTYYCVMTFATKTGYTFPSDNHIDVKPETLYGVDKGILSLVWEYTIAGETEPHTHTLEAIEAKTPTCTEKGNNAYYHCTGCGKYFKDATASVETTADAETLDMIPHDYEWVVTVEPTTEKGGLKEEICKVCGHKSGNKQLLDKLSVEYKLIQGNGETFEQGKEAVFASDAPFAKFVKVYVDGAVLENENYTAKEGSTIITMTAAYTKSLSAGEHTVEIISNDGSATGKFTVKAASLTPPHSHDFGTEWKSDADNHWKECSCGEKSEQAAHSFKWIIDKEATKDKDGSKHEECTVCGYKKNAVKIPATGNDKPTDPTKPADPKSPKTGDESNLMLWISLMVISAGAVGVLGVSRKKKVQK